KFFPRLQKFFTTKKNTLEKKGFKNDFFVLYWISV
ncbi:MAG: hypothetical protein ACI849_000581, partial [Patiriisocius sp.]